MVTNTRTQKKKPKEENQLTFFIESYMQKKENTYFSFLGESQNANFEKFLKDNKICLDRLHLSEELSRAQRIYEDIGAGLRKAKIQKIKYQDC